MTGNELQTLPDKKTSHCNVFVVSSMWGWFGQQKEAKWGYQ